jgi:hypothetical protein
MGRLGMKTWIARFSFSFVVIALWLAWEGYRRISGRGGEPGDGRATLYFVAAAMAFSLGVAGLRERHRGGRRE